jgi:hypothetical protein
MPLESLPSPIPFFDPSWTGGDWQIGFRTFQVKPGFVQLVFDGNAHRIAYWLAAAVSTSAVIGFTPSITGSFGIRLSPVNGQALFECTWAKHGGAVFQPIYYLSGDPGTTPVSLTEVLYLPRAR